ncbi:MAG: hypothetical protein LLF28_07190 [Nitrospiraceae bacterium]|nr:hypothetical protein [Nitrospiraceae bacterium]
MRLKLQPIRNLIFYYKNDLYETGDLPAIFGYISLKTRRLIGRHEKTILISALGLGEILNSINLIREIKVISSYQIVVITRNPRDVRRITQSARLAVIVLPYLFWEWRPIILYWLSKLKPSLILCFETMEQLSSKILELAKTSYNATIVLANYHYTEQYSLQGNVIQEDKHRLKYLNLAGAVSDEARDYLLSCGIPSNSIFITNNLKFDSSKHNVDIEERERIRQQLGISSEEQVLIFGSVHIGEEAILLSAFKEIIKRPGLDKIRLIIAPRYLSYIDKITSSIKDFDLSTVRKTDLNKMLQQNSPVIILDTLGELKKIYSIADVVVIAGSMLPHLQGQNPIEPASMGKPVITGPYMESFKDIMTKFLNHKAIIQINTTEDLAGEITFLFEHAEIRERLGAAAKAVIKECSGATTKYIDRLGRMLNTWVTLFV